MSCNLLKADKELLFAQWDRSAVPLPPAVHPSRGAGAGVAGLLVGLAVGDALGSPAAGMQPELRGVEHGEIRDYPASAAAGGRAVGLPTHRTQSAFLTVISMLRQGQLDPVHLADSYGSAELTGAGSDLREFQMAWGMREVLIECPWFEVGRPSVQSGAISRALVVGLPHMTSPSSALWDDVVAATALTHCEEVAVAAAAGMAGLTLECVAGCPAHSREGDWWLDTFLRYARPLETGRTYPLHGDRFRGLWSSLSAVVDGPVREALGRGLRVVDACAGWGSGSTLLETVPSALYILSRHGSDPEQALVRAVNDTKESGTVAMLVGALAGATHGEEALPLRWRSRLLGRLRRHDDGTVQRVVVDAIGTFLLGEIRP